MEDRKRPASDEANRATPPTKRQALSVNGVGSNQDADMPWKDDIEAYQKDAILRRMQELKREKSDLGEALERIQKDAKYHDEHLRIVDAWFLQLLDEISILTHSAPSAQSTDLLEFSSRLIPTEGSLFEQHLRHQSDEIKSAVSKIFAKLPVSSSDTQGLQVQLSKCLAAEKEHVAQLQRLTEEKNQTSELLDDAVARYMLAEKKLDRARSAQVAQVEAQALSTARNESSGGQTREGREGSQANGIPDEAGASAKIQAAQREAQAVADKRAEQLERLAEQNQKLTQELTVSKSKLANLTDEDYAESELFKSVKSQYEDQIKRVNDLEAKNIELREQITQLQAERTSYREENEKQLRESTIELESQASRGEADLARVRQMRDQKVAELDQRVATMDQTQASLDHMKEVIEAKESRISALESELERLKLEEPSSNQQEDSGNDELRKVQTEKAMLEKELESMGLAWKKMSAAANKKVAEGLRSNENLQKLSQEKARADQKYFATMKLKHAMESELKLQKAQNSKSSEIITQLKEAEASCRGLLANLEKQLAEAKDSLQNLSNQYRTLQQNMSEQKHTSDHLTAQVSELKKSLTVKDNANHSAAQAQRQAETEVSELKVRLEETQKSLESWKKRGLGNQSDEYDALRQIAICAVCKRNFKDTVIRTCGHVFCHECTQERLAARSRKCPICGHSYGHADILKITL